MRRRDGRCKHSARFCVGISAPFRSKANSSFKLLNRLGTFLCVGDWSDALARGIMKPTDRTHQEQKIDEALEQTFPASDTPSFVGGGADSEKESAEKKPDVQKHAHERHAGKPVDRSKREQKIVLPFRGLSGPG
jgi:hypothetical protein